jgi:hypothetical protein
MAALVVAGEMAAVSKAGDGMKSLRRAVSLPPMGNRFGFVFLPETIRKHPAQHEVTMSESEKNRVQPVKQFNIRLPDDLHRELKVKCALDGLSLVEVGEELVRAYLANKVKVTRRPR